MSSNFDDFMREMEEEARQAGPQAEAAFFESQQRHWIGRRLFERRRELGYTQAKLAELSGINQADISKIEHAEANPTLETLASLAAAMGLAVALEPINQGLREVAVQREPKRILRGAIGGVANSLRPRAIASTVRATETPAAETRSNRRTSAAPNGASRGRRTKLG